MLSILLRLLLLLLRLHQSRVVTVISGTISVLVGYAVALTGCLLQTDWFSSVISLALAAVIFLVTYFKTPNINWGSAGQALRYMRASTDLYHLTIMGDHIKNWRYAVR